MPSETSGCLASIAVVRANDAPGGLNVRVDGLADEAVKEQLNEETGGWVYAMTALVCQSPCP